MLAHEQRIKSSFMYDFNHPHIALFNNETADIIHGVKESNKIELDFLFEPKGSLISSEISEILSDFCHQHAKDYQGPALLYAIKIIQERFIFLQRLQHKYNIKFLMAAKSMNEKSIFSLASKYLAGFDVSNLNEYHLLPENLSNKDIFITAPVLTSNFNDFYTKNNTVCFTVNSFEQYNQLTATHIHQDYCIRLDASDLLSEVFETMGEKIHPSHFGTSTKNIKQLKQMVNKSFRGFHMHSGKVEGNPPIAYEIMAMKALELANELNVEIEYLNLGGGIVYFSERELDELIFRLRTFVPPNVQIFFEPGRFITKNAGFALSRIESVNRKEHYADIILDISSQCHLRWSDPMLVAPHDFNDEQLLIRIFGPTCAEIDSLGEFYLPRAASHLLKISNLLLLGGVTGYSASWNKGFNGIPAAGIIFI